MDYIYRETFHIAGNAVDRFNRLRPSALLDMMQQVATNQCALLALDWDTGADFEAGFRRQHHHCGDLARHHQPGGLSPVHHWL